MTVKECYENIGNYEDAVQRLMKDALLKRFLLKFIDDPSYSRLKAALAQEDYPEAFISAHTLKGIAANLSLTEVFEYSNQITEILRDKQPHDVSALMIQLDAAYKKATENIRGLQDENKQ